MEEEGFDSRLTPLQHYIWEGFTLDAKELIEAKADVNVQSLFGQTALHIVCAYDCNLSPKQGHVILKLLLENKANPHLGDKHGCTPFDYAVVNEKSLLVLKILAYAGCWINPNSKSTASFYELRKLETSRNRCRASVVVLYGVLRYRFAQSKDTTQLIVRIMWDKRFDYYF
jgi:ankyrin repeat protein